MPKAWLPSECVCEDREGIVGFAQIRSIYLTRIAGEDDFCSITDSRQDCSEGGGLKILCLINDNHLLLQ